MHQQIYVFRFIVSGISRMLSLMHCDRSGFHQLFLRATAGTAIARLSHRNSVRPPVRHMGGSGKNGAS